LELIKTQVVTDVANLGKVTVDSLIEELIKQGITVAEEVIDNGDGSKTVITDKGYSITLEPNGEDDVTIVLDGKAGALPPRIKKVNINIGTNIFASGILLSSRGMLATCETRTVITSSCGFSSPICRFPIIRMAVITVI